VVELCGDAVAPGPDLVVTALGAAREGDGRCDRVLFVGQSWGQLMNLSTSAAFFFAVAAPAQLTGWIHRSFLSFFSRAM
jgi:hypothetical protein